jgi:surface antigen
MARSVDGDYGMTKRLTVALCAAAFASIGFAGAAFADPSTDVAGDSAAANAAASSVAGAGAKGTLSERASWQCAQFARMFSGIQIFGDAKTWWEQAVGKYARGFTPEAGSVLVFRPFGPMTRGHVAVVSQVLTDRIIQVTHANWSPVEGKRGQIENNVTVVDVSTGGDWSKVKVWYRPSGDLGTTVYPTYGFVYKAAANALSAAKTATASAFDSATRAALSAQIADALR